MQVVKLDIGNKIRILREIKGISKKEVAINLGISQQAYQKIENGQTKITIDKIQNIANTLNMDFDHLINFNPSNYLFQCSQSGVFNTNNITNDNSKMDELIKAKNRVILEQEERIKLLERMLLNIQ